MKLQQGDYFVVRRELRPSGHAVVPAGTRGRICGFAHSSPFVAVELQIPQDPLRWMSKQEMLADVDLEEPREEV